ncbi:MAG: zinc metalloprotease HtpX [Thermofilaceae archaeon]
MKEKILLLLGLVAIAMIAVVIVDLAASWGAPGLTVSYSWWLVGLVGYAISMITLVTAYGIFGRRLSPTPVSLGGLRASMLATSAAVIGGWIIILAFLSAFLNPELISQLTFLSLVYAAIPSLFSWLLSPALINLIYGCHPDPSIQEVVNRVAAKAGMKPPKAMIARMKEPNAFAYSSPILGSYIAVTEGMLHISRVEELEAVIGHELGHHKHRDNVVVLVFGLLPSVIYFLGRYLMYAGMYSRYYYDGDRSRRSEGNFVFLLTGIALMAISVLIQLGVLALSRLREFYADAHGAKVTTPDSMIGALHSLNSFYNRYKAARAKVDSSKLKMLFIYALTDPYIGFEELLSTHPPIEKRIAFLSSLRGTSIKA